MSARHALRALGLLAALVVLLCACRKAPGAAGGPDGDRIVTVGSAVTEAVFALGAGDRVVAVDTSSLYPAEATTLPKVGYQRALSAEGLLSLRPSLVLGSAEAGPPPVLEQLRDAGVRVEIVDAEPTVAGGRARLAKIAGLLGRDAGPVLARFDDEVARAVETSRRAEERPRALVLYARGAGTTHVFGRGTVAATMLELAGAENAVTAFEGAKPLTAEALVAAAPEVVVVPSLGLAALGGVDGVLAVPGMRETPAGKARRVIELDDLLLLGLGPRTGEGALRLHAALRETAREARRR